MARAVFKLDDQGHIEETAMELLVPGDRFFMRESTGHLVSGGCWPTRCLWVVLEEPRRMRMRGPSSPMTTGVEAL